MTGKQGGKIFNGSFSGEITAGYDLPADSANASAERKCSFGSNKQRKWNSQNLPLLNRPYFCKHTEYELFIYNWNGECDGKKFVGDRNG